MPLSRIHTLVKSFFYHILEEPDSPARHFFNLIMMVVIVMSVMVMVVELEPGLTAEERHYFGHLEEVFIAIFLAEYLLRWWVVSDFSKDFKAASLTIARRRHRASPSRILLSAFAVAMRPKLRWMIQPLSIVDLLAILPIFRPFRLLRILRVLRLLKLFRYSRQMSLFGEVIHERRFELFSMGMAAIITYGMVAVAFFVVEHETNSKVNTIWEALYWSVITIATVGYGDITPITPMGKVIAVVGTLFGMWVVVFFTSIIVSTLTERLIALKEHKMERQIDRLRNHFIVCGIHNLGRAVCTTLAYEKTPFVAVDNNQEHVDYAHAQGWVAMLGDARESELWSKLGLVHARGVIASIVDESVNIYITLTVREQRPDCFIVVCGSSRASEKRLLKVGANRVISPFEIGGSQMAQIAMRPTVLKFFDLALKRDHHELEMEELMVGPDSAFDGVSLMESRIRNEFNVIVVGAVPKGGSMIFNPRPDHILRGDDLLICLGHFDDLERMRQAMRRND